MIPLNQVSIGNNTRLPEIQKALLKSCGHLINSSSLISLTTIKDSSPLDDKKVEMPLSLLKELSNSFEAAYAKDWTMPRVTSPLSTNEINFLNNFKITDLCSGKVTSSGSHPIIHFFIQVLCTVGSQIIVSEIGSAIKESESKSNPKDGSSSIKRSIASQNEDPGLKEMKKKVSKEASKLIGKTAINMTKEELINLTAKGSKKLHAANKIFVDSAFKTGANTVKGLGFIAKAYDKGLEFASLEAAKNFTIKFITKHPAAAASLACSEGGPVAIAGCAVFFNTLFSNIFETPPELATGIIDSTPP